MIGLLVVAHNEKYISMVSEIYTREIFEGLIILKYFDEFQECWFGVLY